MAKVCLMPADPTHDENHWANPYGVFKRAFMKSKDWQHLLLEDPDKADVIIICGPLRNSRFPIALLSNSVIRKNMHKCVWFSTEDDAFQFLVGIYTSLINKGLDRKYFRGGFYPHVALGAPLEPFSLEADFKYLFSFCGSFDTHRVRERIGLITHPRGKIKNTDKDPGRGYGQGSEVYGDYAKQLVDSIMLSKFVLCPRGKCPSSHRLFQTMKARRVPVVISDDWERPPHVPWDVFCVFVRERDIFNIPEILARAEDNFPEKATAARKAWEQYFAFENLANTVTDWSLEVLTAKNTHRGTLCGVPFSTCCKALLSWQFYRRGLAPEIKYWIKNRRLS